MQIYNTGNTENSLIHECWDLCSADINSYPLAKVIRRFNIALEQVVAWILGADDTWQWDDTNYTNFPIGTQTLVNAQGKYSFNDKFLEIDEVLVLDNNSNWIILKPIDQKEFDDILPLSEAFKADGLPQYYDKITDDTIQLYPAPATGYVTMASGLKIKYRRTADLFTIFDTTQEPGLASPYHVILAYMGAIPYCETFKKDRVAIYERKVGNTPIPTGLKEELLNHYSRRERDKRKKMTTLSRSYK